MLSYNHEVPESKRGGKELNKQLPPGFYLCHRDKDGNLLLRQDKIYVGWHFATNSLFLTVLIDVALGMVLAIAFYFCSRAGALAIEKIDVIFPLREPSASQKDLTNVLSYCSDYGSAITFVYFVLKGLLRLVEDLISILTSIFRKG